MPEDKTLICTFSGHRESLFWPNKHSSCVCYPEEVECVAHPFLGWITPSFNLYTHQIRHHGMRKIISSRVDQIVYTSSRINPDTWRSTADWVEAENRLKIYWFIDSLSFSLTLRPNRWLINRILSLTQSPELNFPVGRHGSRRARCHQRILNARYGKTQLGLIATRIKLNLFRLCSLSTALRNSTLGSQHLVHKRSPEKMGGPTL